MPPNQPTFDLQAHFDRLYQAVPGEFRFRATSPAGLRRWQKSFRARLRQVLGLERMEKELAGHRPTGRRVEAVDAGDHVREKWYLQTEPDVPLPFWLLIPKRGRGPRPVALTPHGHNHPNIDYQAGCWPFLRKCFAT